MIGWGRRHLSKEGARGEPEDKLGKGLLEALFYTNWENKKNRERSRPGRMDEAGMPSK